MTKTKDNRAPGGPNATRANVAGDAGNVRPGGGFVFSGERPGDCSMPGFFPGIRQDAPNGDRSTGRDGRGRFSGPGAANRGRPAAVPRIVTDEIRSDAEAFRAALVREKGGEARLSVFQREDVERLTQMRITLRVAWDAVLTGGVCSSRGEVRPAMTLFLMASDRFDRIAKRLDATRAASSGVSNDDLHRAGLAVGNDDQPQTIEEWIARNTEGDEED